MLNTNKVVQLIVVLKRVCLHYEEAIDFCRANGLYKVETKFTIPPIEFIKGFSSDSIDVSSVYYEINSVVDINYVLWKKRARDNFF